MRASTSVDAPARAVSLDVLRGLVMVLMVVDHAREYAAGPGRLGDPMDLDAVSPLLFWMRWAAHFCAPVFVLLAGVSARLQGARMSRSALARHLALRGVVLVLLEFTLVDWGWTFFPAWPLKFAQVIWGIGLALLALAAMVRLPARVILAIGLVLVGGHNLLDGVRVTGDGALRYVWAVLHQREVLPLAAGCSVRTSYPVLPLVGLVAIGYGIGQWWGAGVDAVHRRRRLLCASGLAIALFLLLRLTGAYGDPHRMVVSPDLGRTVQSVLNVTKYPISLAFALMTIGPALLLLAWWEQSWQARATHDGFATSAVPVPQWARMLALLGRVPMFFYIAHLWALHALALLAALLVGFPATAFDFAHRFGGVPQGFGFPLWGTLPFAVVTTVALYPACRWYDGLRASRRYRWTRFL